MSDTQSIFALFNAKNYVSYNRHIAHIIGLNPTILLSEIIDAHQYFKSKGELRSFDDGVKKWFYMTEERAKDRTALSPKEQKGAINVLLHLGLIERTNRGVPCKRFFAINEERLRVFFENSNNFSRNDLLQNLICKMEKLDQQNGKTLNKEPEKEPKENSSSSSSSSSSSDEGEVASDPKKDADVDVEPPAEEEKIGKVPLSRIRKALEEKGFGISVVDPTIDRIKKRAQAEKIDHPFSYALKIAAKLAANEQGVVHNHSPGPDKPSEATKTVLCEKLEERKQVSLEYASLFKDIPGVEVRHNEIEMIIDADGRPKSIPFCWSDSEWDKSIELLMPWDRLED